MPCGSPSSARRVCASWLGGAWQGAVELPFTGHVDIKDATAHFDQLATLVRAGGERLRWVRRPAAAREGLPVSHARGDAGPAVMVVLARTRQPLRLQQH